VNTARVTSTRLVAASARRTADVAARRRARHRAQRRRPGVVPTHHEPCIDTQRRVPIPVRGAPNPCPDVVVEAPTSCHHAHRPHQDAPGRARSDASRRRPRRSRSQLATEWSVQGGAPHPSTAGHVADLFDEALTTRARCEDDFSRSCRTESVRTIVTGGRSGGSRPGGARGCCSSTRRTPGASTDLLAGGKPSDRPPGPHSRGSLGYPATVSSSRGRSSRTCADRVGEALEGRGSRRRARGTRSLRHPRRRRSIRRPEAMARSWASRPCRRRRPPDQTRRHVRSCGRPW
jgi:hypothetical protein